MIQRNWITASAVWVVVACASTAFSQITVPTSHPGSLPGAPTESILIDSTNLAQYQAWWAAPANSVQAAWKSNINSYANQTLSTATPISFALAVTQSQIAQAKALRWLVNPSAPTAAADLAAVTAVLKNARVSTNTSNIIFGYGTNITRPEVAMSYFSAYDYINAGLSAADRTTITTRLTESEVLVTLTQPAQINNQRAKYASTRAFAALLFNNDSQIDSMLSQLSSSFASNTTDDGGYTDGLRYFNYTIAQAAPFMVAYQNHSGADFSAQAEEFIKYSLGVRMPNGTVPSAHNSDNMPVAIHQFSQLVSDPDIKAAALWNVTQLPGHDWTSWSNAVNNDWTYADFFAITDFSTTPAAPNWSPTYFSGGQAAVTTFREDWGKTSDYLNMSAGVDGSSGAGFTHHDTGGLSVVANGTQVIVEPATTAPTCPTHLRALTPAGPRSTMSCSLATRAAARGASATATRRRPPAPPPSQPIASTRQSMAATRA